MLAALTLAGCDDKEKPVKTYTVTFDAAGGAPVPPKQTVEAGETATAPQTNPAKQDYVFLYWSLNGSTTAYNFQTPVNSDITLAANWQEESKVEYWQVAWELNGGAWPGGDNHATQVAKGGTLAEPAEPVKAGSEFEGWYKEAALTNKVTFPYDVSAVTADITLYAKWEDETNIEYWQVAWELGGGEWPEDDNHATQVVKGGTLAEPAPPVKEGSTFEGWYKEAALTNKVNFPYDVSGVNANFTLYTKWEGIAEAGQLEVFYSDDNTIHPTDALPNWFFDDGEGGWWFNIPFIVRTNQTSWEAASDQEWCLLERSDASSEDFPEGEEGFFIYFEPNPSDLTREVTITVTAGNAEPVAFSILQKGGEHGMGLYLGTWRLTRNDGYWEQVIISADKVVLMTSQGSNFVMTGLTWNETVNPVSNDYYSDGYKVTGTLTSTNGYTIPSASGSGNATVGGAALVTFYIGLNKNYIAMGNWQTVQQEAYYGAYYWKVDTEYWQVTWDLDGGSWPSNPNQLTMVAKDGKLAAPKAPTKSGVYFTGCSRNGSSVSFPYDVSTVTGDFTLTARYGAPATLRVSVNPGAGFYTSISAMPVSGGAVQTNIPTSYGTHTVNVPQGTYRIFYSYWSCSNVSCMSSGYSGNFIIFSGQTQNISLVGSAVSIQ